MKSCILITIPIILLFISPARTIQDMESFFSEEQSAEIFKSMGLDKKEEMTLKEFKIFFYRIITQDKPAENPAFYEAVRDKIAKGMPKVILMKDAEKYLGKERVMNVIIEVVKEQYGEDYVPQVKQAFEEAFKQNKKIIKKKEEQLKNQTKEEEESKITSEPIEDL